MVWPGPGLLLGSDFSLCLHMAESRKEQARDLAAQPCEGKRTRNVNHVEYIRAKMAKSVLAGV